MLSKTLSKVRYLITHIKGNQDYLAKAKQSKNYILNFSAVWCGPCKAIAPVLEKKEKQSNGKWKVLKVDIDDELNSQLSQKFQIQAVPTMIYFKDGKEVHRTLGGMSSDKLDEAIKKIL